MSQQAHGIVSGVSSFIWSIFGLMFLGVGAALYQLKCPPFVKKYGDWADYVAGVAPHADYKSMVSLGYSIGRDPGRDQLTGTSDDWARSYLREHYGLMSIEFRGWRIATAVLFAWGFALLAIPSFMTAVRVAIAFITSEYSAIAR
jgi:hypothetical protein